MKKIQSEHAKVIELYEADIRTHININNKLRGIVEVNSNENAQLLRTIAKLQGIIKVKSDELYQMSEYALNYQTLQGKLQAIIDSQDKTIANISAQHSNSMGKFRQIELRTTGLPYSYPICEATKIVEKLTLGIELHVTPGYWEVLHRLGNSNLKMDSKALGDYAFVWLQTLNYMTKSGYILPESIEIIQVKGAKVAVLCPYSKRFTIEQIRQLILTYKYANDRGDLLLNQLNIRR